MINLSIIVLTCDSYTNKFSCIEHTILSLCNQKGISKEIIVVNNGIRKSDTLHLQKFTKSLSNIKVICTKQKSISEARNIGSQEASADILVFIDEDIIILDKLALSKIYNYSFNYIYGYGAKRDWTLGENWFPSQAETIKQNMLKGNYSLIRKNIGCPDPFIRDKNTIKYLIKSFIGNFGFIHKEAFKKLGGFPTQFAGYGLEDDALSFLCYLHHGNPALLSNIHIVHVTHPINATCLTEYNKNKLIYNELLNSHGYTNFHIGDLLYPSVRNKRPILE
jgi:glycosyltransferase involved in cell wall biosynthesis